MSEIEKNEVEVTEEEKKPELAIVEPEEAEDEVIDLDAEPAPGEADLSGLGALGGLGALLSGMGITNEMVESEEEEKEPEHVQLTEQRAMVMLPKDAVEIELIANIYENGSISRVSKVITNEEIQKAFRDADRNYVDDEDVFVFADDESKEDEEGWESCTTMDSE